MSVSVKLDEFHRHEAVDRVFMFAEMFDEHVMQHPAVEQEPELAKLAHEIGTLLGRLYQAAGALRHPVEKP